jgi:DNA-binding response OmpR family regulator
MDGKKEILIVEDNDDLRGMFSKALTLAGFEIHEARAGYEALLLLDSRRPDLVVLDLGLPGIDGFAVQREIAANAFLRHISVVVVTASMDDLSHLDVACVLRKPVHPEKLIQTVSECLAKAAPQSRTT